MPTIGIIGAGTMGAGIAHVAAQGGWNVQLRDVDADVVDKAVSGVRARFDRNVEKGRMTPDERDAAAARLHVAVDRADFADAEIVLEAIVEDLAVKVRVLGEFLPTIRDDAIIATNTSSLSVTTLGERLHAAPRTVGMHFFNPAPLMKLVEVIAGAHTDPAVVDRIADVATSWGKVVARAADVPGFIVNHVARPYYLEAFRILEDRLATPDRIDETMRTLGGFRMGPLELTDLIGQDVNTATTRSVWTQLDKPPLLEPSAVQEQLVADGRLGRKTKRGVYDYAGGDPTAGLVIETVPLDLDTDAQRAVTDFVAHAVETPGDPDQNYIFARILCGLIRQAMLAHERGVATQEDIDAALRFGVNYPRGPFDWARDIGADRVEAMFAVLGDRFAGVRPASS